MVGARPSSAKHRLTLSLLLKVQDIVKCADNSQHFMRSTGYIFRVYVSCFIVSLQATILVTTNMHRLNEESNIQLKRKMKKLRLARSLVEVLFHQQIKTQKNYMEKPTTSQSFVLLLQSC